MANSSTQHMPYRILPVELDQDVTSDFARFAQKVTEQDGTPAFSEQTLVEFAKYNASAETPNSESSVNVIGVFATGEGLTPMGVAVAVLDTKTHSATIEGAVLSEYRNQGLGAELARALMNELSHRAIDSYDLWVHQLRSEGESQQRQATQKIAQSFGFEPARELRKLRLELTESAQKRIEDTFTQTTLPEGITLDTYKVGHDDAAWLATNAAAFATHPEQGSLTLDDLRARQNSDWFDAEGFFVARDEKTIAGFNWTKIPTHQQGETEGEVYAVGISPKWQGKKLGKALTLAGMNYLASAHDKQNNALTKIVLYVDADNTAAVSLYESLGFETETIDVMYHKN
ncbi:MAG: mycothiol synthase [Rothia sp. (in: high G+C Gram-positive bacteria)]|nr:mycothiol synthase [Rothia sp. (in: high G+C Gram-positive bacteria)]